MPVRLGAFGAAALSVAATASLCLTLIAGAAAQSPPPAAAGGLSPKPVTGFVPAFEIMRTVRSAGFDPLAPPLREGTTYVLRATDYRGILMRVVLDARTGAIRDVTRIVPAASGSLGVVLPPYGPPAYASPYGEPPYGAPAEYEAPVPMPLGAERGGLPPQLSPQPLAVPPLTHAKTSHAKTSRAKTSHAKTSQAETSHAKTSQAETSHAETSHAETSHAETSHAETSPRRSVLPLPRPRPAGLASSQLPAKPPKTEKGAVVPEQSSASAAEKTTGNNNPPQAAAPAASPPAAQAKPPASAPLSD